LKLVTDVDITPEENVVLLEPIYLTNEINAVAEVVIIPEATVVNVLPMYFITAFNAAGWPEEIRASNTFVGNT
jgi:hypothetical protein